MAHTPHTATVLFDIGANVGLVTRQLIHRLPQVVAAVCFEPHPGHFRLLQRNLAHLPQCHAVQATVGDRTGELTFYEDARNAGNCSLNRVMELWRIDRPAFDQQRFASLLAGFRVRRFAHDPSRNLTVDEILAYSAGRDREQSDLLFARA